jgi:hypothetical protein
MRPPRLIGCGHRPRELETAEIPDAFEESLTGAEQHRHQVNLHFADQAGGKVLPGRARATRERYIQSSRRHDTLGHERERRSALKRERRARVVRKHEYGVVKWGIHAPPTASTARRHPTGPGGRRTFCGP